MLSYTGPSDLSRLLRPASIAVIGGGWARNVIEQCQKAGYVGELWPVHPREETVAGLKCYASLAELPGPPDAAFVGINRDATVDVIVELSRMGCGSAICFASGFSEASAEDERGEQLQQALVAAAGDMPIVGPNCYGVLNYVDGAMLWPDQHGGVACDSGIALITQSSNIAISLTMQTRGLPIAYVMTAGNQAQQSLGALGSALLADDRVTALGMYIEGFGDLREFEAMAASARKLGKPVVAIKAGRSSVAQLAMQSHTNSLATNDAAADAFLERIGVVRVESLSVLIEALKLLHFNGPLNGNRVQSMSCSGGEASIMSDAAESIDIEYPELVPTQASSLRAALGPLVALANPLDYHTYIWDDVQAMQKAFAAMMQGAADITCLVLDFPRGDRCDPSSWYTAVDALAAAAKEQGRVAAILATLPENLGEADAAFVISKGLIPLCGVNDALEAVAIAARCKTGLQAAPQPLLLLSGLDIDAEPIELDELTAKQKLGAAGLQVPDAVEVSLLPGSAKHYAPDPHEWKRCISTLNFPVVLKAQGLLHKSDVGGVVTGIENPQQLEQAMLDMRHRLGELDGRADRPFLVESQVSSVIAELLVSVVRDPVLGLMLTVAAGGTHTELWQDSAQLLLPATPSDIVGALGKLRVSMLLDGYRGSRGCDREALLKAVGVVAQFALDHQDSLLELEINPLLCTADDAVAGDAILRFS